MNWLLPLFLAASIAPETTTVRLDRNGWVFKDTEKVSAGETRWTWSRDCAPQKTPGAETVCAPARPLQIRVTDAKQRPVLNARVVWGTEEMLRAIPDSHLPSSLLSDAGEGTVAAPQDSEIWLRVDGERVTSAWTRVRTQDTSISIMAVPSARLRIDLASTDGRPVRNARLALLPRTCETLCPQRLLAHDDGEHPATFPAVEGVAYRLVTWSDSHAPVARDLTARRASNLVVDVPPGSSLSARLVDGDRNPIDEAELEVRFALPSLRQFGRRVVVQSDGLTIGGLPTGPVEWKASASGFASRIAEATLSEPVVKLGDITLVPARTVRVLVLDESRRGVPDARVVVETGGSRMTDASGTALFDALPRTGVPFVVKADGFLPGSGTIQPDENEASVMLDRGASVTATLLREADGVPPSEVHVRITNRGTESLKTLKPDPGLSISALHPGPVRLRITSAETAPFDTGSFELDDGETIDLGVLTLKPGYSLHGSVADEKGLPVPGARIRVLRLDGDLPALADVLGNWVKAVSDSDGSFRLSGLSAGSQIVVADAEGFAQIALRDVQLDEETRDADLGIVTLPRGKELQVVCHPVKRCGTEVSVLLAGSDFPFISTRAPLEQGRATVHAVAPGTKVLRLLRAQHVIYDRSIRVGGGTSPEMVEVTLPSVRLSGRVLLGGRVARGGSLFLERSMGGAAVPVLLGRQTENGSTLSREWRGSMGASTVAEVDDRGQFTTEEIEPGGYDVTYRSGGSATTSIPVTVYDTADQVVDLAFDAHQIGGIVLDRSDRPTVARIEAVDATGRTHTATSGIDGRFRIIGIAAGQATVKAATSTAKAELRIDATQRSALDLVLRLTEEREVLRVQVSDAVGNPAAGCLVFGIVGTQMVAASTDPNGEAELRGLGTGRVQVAAHRVGGAWVFGSAQEGSPAQLQFVGREGALAVRGGKPQRILSISTPAGFPLHRVLPMAGISLELLSGSLLQIRGLPAGQYVVGGESGQRAVNVVAGEVTELQFD